MARTSQHFPTLSNISPFPVTIQLSTKTTIQLLYFTYWCFDCRKKRRDNGKHRKILLSFVRCNFCLTVVSGHVVDFNCDSRTVHHIQNITDDVFKSVLPIRQPNCLSYISLFQLTTKMAILKVSCNF